MRKNAFRVFWLLPFVMLPGTVGAQSASATSGLPNNTISADQAEKQEMWKELKALREEVERLRAEVEQDKADRRGTEPQKSAADSKAESADFTRAPGAAAPALGNLAAAPAPGFASTATSDISRLTLPLPTSLQSAATAPAQPSEQAVTETQPTNRPIKIAPFSDWDWTWLNGNPRNKDVAFDSKFFTPEIRADINYTYDFNKPKDDSMTGSSEIFRSNEIQLEQLGVGGDFHYDNVRARLMTQFGMYSETTPRNDPSTAKGQWDLDTAYRYISEAYGGYHINALDGINIDAGIFMSYIGLFSYYNYDNWAYQPSYVSSNTPWFFNGLRVQIFPTPHLKIEPWLINGWQSYGSANSRKGVGGQIKWTPYSWMNVISNNYGVGHDDLYTPNRGRIHTDDSVEIKYYDHPERTFDKMAFTFTGDMGCEFGPSGPVNGTYIQGVGCHGDTKDAKSIGGDYFGPGINPKQSFIGFMLYDRTWFKKDRYAFTVGGGAINNPGRYLVLVPPINGETAPSAAISSPYFGENPSDPFKAWDSSFTFDYMPRQWLTFRWEYDYRHASVPYWSGAGGVTPPPGTNNNYPQYYACSTGASSMQSVLSAAETACGGGLSSVWFPDTRRDEQFIDLDILVKF
jgi:hypothetical protein